MWLYKGTCAFIAGSNKRISKTEIEQTAAKSSCDNSSHEEKHIVVYNCQTLTATVQHRQFSVPEAFGCILHQGLSEKEASQIDFADLLSESEFSSASQLLTLSELEVLGTSLNHNSNADNENNLALTDITNNSNLSIVECECKCSLCLNRKKAIESSASKAKRFIDEAVRNSSKSIYIDNVNKDSFPKDCQFYLINLVHLLLVIAGLRGMI